MKILQVITDTDRRGAQVFALDLEAELRKVGHVVTSVALIKGATSDHLGVQTLGKRSRGVTTLIRLRKLSSECDVVIAHGSSTGLATRLALIGSPTPFIYRQISDLRFWAPTRFKRIRVRWFLKKAHAVVALSQESRDVLENYIGVDKGKISVIPNGVDEGRFSAANLERRRFARNVFGLPLDCYVVAYLGALVPEKGVHLAIRAFESLQDSWLLVVGDGPLRNALEELSLETGANVLFSAGRSDIQSVYDAADVLVLPSLGGDSMPAVLIEAGLSGLPCISTEVGAIPEVVLDGETGMIMKVVNDFSLRDALLFMKDNPQVRFEMGSEARKFCLKSFSIAEVGRQWDQVVKHLN